MQPILSIVIPCYNGESFLDHSIHSLVNQRIIDEVSHLFEIIFIDDGSKDESTIKAKKHADKWNEEIRKDFIRVIKKPNGQYGSVINRGLKEAKGMFFKVLDVDDTFNTTSFIDLIHTIIGLKVKPDVIFTDHVFEKVGTDMRDVQSLRKWFEPNKLIKLTDQKFPQDLITMHSIIYRTNLLKDIDYSQIEGVYYSDSQYSLIPLMFARSMYYVEMPLYRYYIGRGEQSINLKVMVRNRNHQLEVLKAIFKDIKITKRTPAHLRNYAALVMRRMIQWQAMLIVNDKEVHDKRKQMLQLLEECKQSQPIFYKEIAKGAFFGYIKVLRGFGMPTLLKYGIRLYSVFKKNIMAEWD